MSTAIWGLPGYTFKGIYKEIQKHLGSSVQNYIVAARTAQGYDEWHRSSREERIDVVQKWHTIQLELTNEKQNIRHGSLHGPSNYIKTHHLNHKERQRIAAEKKRSKPSRKDSKQLSNESTSPQITHTTSSESGEFEGAIQASVAATSQGNPDEDRLIEQAIRASIRELQKAGRDGDDADALQRAIQASVAEAARARAEFRSVSDVEDTVDHDNILANALHRSLTEEKHHPLDYDDSGVDTEDDENVKAAIHQSTAPVTGNDPDKELEVKQAMKVSQETHEKHIEQLERAKTEEEIVIDYVKRQSLLEEDNKKNIQAK